MHPLASAEGAASTTGDTWYRISTGDDVPTAPDRTRRSHGTVDVFQGDLFIDAGTTTATVEITMEAWAAEPPLRAAPGGFAEVVETSVAVRAARVRVLAADGSEVLALDAGAGDHRLRLYSRFLDPRRQTHLLRLWPAAPARDWDYALDGDGQPVPRPDRGATETLTVAMPADQANALRMEVEETALLETQRGDVDDVVEDCLRIRELVEYRTDPAGEVRPALTARQWKVALAVLDHRAEVVAEPDWAERLRAAHQTITAQIGSRLPPGRVYGL
ncbi:hypothetical protein GWI34_02940 [Actinomadura sp. DSM 109109]|nr:hypothetical protein [Actinomadura lepetitiana]